MSIRLLSPSENVTCRLSIRESFIVTLQTRLVFATAEEGQVTCRSEPNYTLIREIVFLNNLIYFQNKPEAKRE